MRIFEGFVIYEETVWNLSKVTPLPPVRLLISYADETGRDVCIVVISVMRKARLDSGKTCQTSLARNLWLCVDKEEGSSFVSSILDTKSGSPVNSYNVVTSINDNVIDSDTNCDSNGDCNTGLPC